ncbi:MAG TPA: cytochrome c biogenesis CcdA family protein, partial [Acidimicrobiales bacterium]|nr:cytochrome c biogenesis CcdA family protein [Acidimicrobiales bacterium]
MFETAAIHADPLGLLVAFGAGMLSFLSPCVLPLVPAYLSMVSGLSAAELSALGSKDRSAQPQPLVPVAVGPAGPSPEWDARPDGGVAGAERPGGADLAKERSRLLRGILAFIAGFTVVFTILGASASAIGRLFLTHQRSLETVSGILIVAFGALLVAMAAGAVLPVALSGERRFVVRPSVLGAWAPPIMGMAFAFAWTPCIGPVLASVLALAAGT